MKKKNNKYKAIQELHEILLKAEYYHEYLECMDGFQIIIYAFGKRIGDFIEHQFSYGLEAMGFDLDIQPYLTEQKALDIVKKYIKKVGKGNEYAATRIYN